MNQAARILVVDDESTVRHLLAILLRRQGYEVCTAADSGEAYAWLHKEVFDLLLIDLMLCAGVSGLEIAQDARAYQPDVAVLILTGSDAFAKILGAPPIEHFEIMHKTASPQDVLAQVAALLARKRERPQFSI